MLHPLCFYLHAVIRKKTFREYGQFVKMILFKGHYSFRASKKKSFLNIVLKLHGSQLSSTFRLYFRKILFLTSFVVSY